MAASKTMLVIGATGVIGRTLIAHLDGLDDWDAIAVSRRPPDFPTRARHLAVDLTDPDDCRAKLGALGAVTHVCYAAYTDRPTWAEQCAPNAAMLRNALDGIEAGPARLRRFVLMQGTKYYGSHLGPFKTPAFEDDPRHMPPNFYFDQQDLLAERQRGRDWHWTLLRPHTVCGFAVGMPLNLVPVIAVWAAVSKELGLPLRFPGTEGAFRATFQVTDAALLARATVWAAESDAAENQAFNITNGDYFRWQHLWPRFAAFFGMEAGPPQRLDLARFMADKAPLWQRMVERYDLLPIPWEQAVNWSFGDYIFNQDWDIMSSTLKARQAGFQDCLESGEMFLRLFAELRERRFVP